MRPSPHSGPVLETDGDSAPARRRLSWPDPIMIVLLACVAAATSFTPRRLPALILAGVVVVTTAIHNNWQFVRAARFLQLMAQLVAAYNR